MPEVVVAAQEAARRCERAGTPLPPVSAEVLEALRAYFSDEITSADMVSP
jgi:hypothetical protein